MEIITLSQSKKDIKKYTATPNKYLYITFLIYIGSCEEAITLYEHFDVTRQGDIFLCTGNFQDCLDFVIQIMSGDYSEELILEIMPLFRYYYRTDKKAFSDFRIEQQGKICKLHMVKR